VIFGTRFDDGSQSRFRCSGNAAQSEIDDFGTSEIEEILIFRSFDRRASRLLSARSVHHQVAAIAIADFLIGAICVDRTLTRDRRVANVAQFQFGCASIVGHRNFVGGAYATTILITDGAAFDRKVFVA